MGPQGGADIRFL